MVNIFDDREGGPKGARGAPGPARPPGSRGPAGLKGDPGKCGSGGIDDMCRCIPDLILEQFQERETCCFKIPDVSKDLHKDKDGAYVTWISRSASKKNIVAIHPSKYVLHISQKQNALVFDKSLYRVDDVVLVPSHPSYVYVCVTFRTDCEQEQTIIFSYDLDNPGDAFREISASIKK